MFALILIGCVGSVSFLLVLDHPGLAFDKDLGWLRGVGKPAKPGKRCKIDEKQVKVYPRPSKHMKNASFRIVFMKKKRVSL